MRLTSALAAALFSVGLLGAGTAVQAQGIEFGPGGVRIDPGFRRPPPPPPLDDEGISEREAMRIARRQGVIDIEVVRPTQRGGWQVIGVDREGEDIRVIISRFGEVVSVR